MTNQELPKVIRVKLELEYYPQEEPEIWEMMSVRQILNLAKESYVIDINQFSNEELFESLETEIN